MSVCLCVCFRRWRQLQIFCNFPIFLVGHFSLALPPCALIRSHRFAFIRALERVLLPCCLFVSSDKDMQTPEGASCLSAAACSTENMLQPGIHPPHPPLPSSALLSFIHFFVYCPLWPALCNEDWSQLARVERRFYSLPCNFYLCHFPATFCCPLRFSSLRLPLPASLSLSFWLSFNMKNCAKYLRSVAQEAANVKSGACSNCENLSVLLRAKGSDGDEADDGNRAILIVGPTAGIQVHIK